MSFLFSGLARSAIAFLRAISLSEYLDSSVNEETKLNQLSVFVELEANRSNIDVDFL